MGKWKDLTPQKAHEAVATRLGRPLGVPALPIQKPAADPTALVLGRDELDRPAGIALRARLEHAHVIGTTGGGKTNFLAHCIRQDIIAGRGVCVVDPHGNHPDSLYRSLIAWLDARGLHKKRVVHLIDPNAPTHTVGFNPVWLPPGYHPSVVAGTTLEAFARVWGDEDLKQKPTISRLLTATFMALAEQGLTLAEARLLFDPHDTHGIRALVLSKLSEGHARDVLHALHQLSIDEGKNKRDFRAEAVGPMNRLAEFVSSDAVRAIIGQSDNTIDLRAALDEGHVILANLAGGSQVYDGHCELLGRLLVRYLFFWAKAREHPERPFFVYLDECQRYLSGDVPNLLAELRKYGVGAVLAHQWQAQLGAEDENLLAAVRSATNLKAVFRVKDAQEAAELAELVVTLNLEEPVAALIKPTVVGHQRTIFNSWAQAEHHAKSRANAESYSESDSDSESEGTSSSAMLGAGLGASTAMMVPTNGFMITPDMVVQTTGDTSSEASGTQSSNTRSRSHSASWSESTVEAEMHGTSIQHGQTEGLEPIYADLPSTVHSKENQLYKAALMLRQLPTGTAYMNFAGNKGMLEAKVRVPPFTAPKLSESAFADLRAALLDRSPSATPRAHALKRLQRREQLLIHEAAEARRPPPEPEDPQEFRAQPPNAPPEPEPETFRVPPSEPAMGGSTERRRSRGGQHSAGANPVKGANRRRRHPKDALDGGAPAGLPTIKANDDGTRIRTRWKR